MYRDSKSVYNAQSKGAQSQAKRKDILQVSITSTMEEEKQYYEKEIKRLQDSLMKEIKEWNNLKSTLEVMERQSEGLMRMANRMSNDLKTQRQENRQNEEKLKALQHKIHKYETSLTELGLLISIQQENNLIGNIEELSNECRLPVTESNRLTEGLKKSAIDENSAGKG